MIGLRVKAWFCAVAVVLSAGCSSKPVKESTGPQPARIPSGTRAWSDGALLLPADSPAVFTGRLDVVLDTATRLKAWVIAEPAMLGSEGPDIVRAIESGWIAATAYLGVDPLARQTWVDRGMDPSREFFIGAYPVQKDGRRFVNSVETVLRDELGLAPGQSVSGSLHQLAAVGGELPEGTHARILRTLDQTRPLGGLRVVIAVTNPDEFLTTASSFAEGMGFRPFGPELDNTVPERRMWSDAGQVPAMSIRFAGGYAVLDLLFPAFVGAARSAMDPRAELAELHASLGRAMEEIPSGRPRAPAPPGAPAVSVSFDQASMGEFMRLRGYWHGLDELHATSTDRRDAELLNMLASVVSEADVWDVASGDLSGTSFDLSIDPVQSRVLGRARMTLFAREGLTLPDTSRQGPTLELPRRSAGFSIDLAALRAPTWQSWFAGKSAAEFNALQFAAMRPSRTLLPGLRAGAIAVSSLGHPASAAALSESLGEALEQLREVQRFEVVALAPDVAKLHEQPEIVCIVVLNPDAPASVAGEVQVAMTGALLGWTNPDIAVPAMTPLTLGVTSASMVGNHEVRQHMLEVGGHRVVVFGVGVGEEAFAAELGPLSMSKSLDGAIRGRLEPIALLSWLRDGDGDVFDPVDVDILAQRLGALTLTYQSMPVEGAATMSLELRLDAPPRL